MGKALTVCSGTNVCSVISNINSASLKSSTWTCGKHRSNSNANERQNQAKVCLDTVVLRHHSTGKDV